MDASSPASSRGAERQKSTSASADFEDRAAAQVRKYPVSDANEPDSGTAQDAKRLKDNASEMELEDMKRVVEVCNKYGLIKGDSFDLRTGFDLSDPGVQQRVSRRIIETEAALVILSPPCTKFSTLQALNIHIHGPEWEKAFEIEREQARKHIAYSIRLAKLQMKKGRYFLFEHPAHATSWGLPEMIELLSMDSVSTVIGDQCMYGLTTLSEDRKTQVPAKKPTQFASNGPCILAVSRTHISH